MEIEPVSPATSTSGREQALDLWARTLRARAGSGRPAASAGTSQPDLPSSDGMELEYAQHEGTGAQVVRLVVADTGQVISEMPHQQVLDLVARLMQQNEDGREDSHAEH